MPLSEGNIVFITSGYKKGSMAVKIDKNKPTILWQSKTIEGQQTDPVILDGYVYGYSGNSTSIKGELVCLDIKGNLFLVEASTEKFVKAGELKKAIPDVKHPAWTAPVIANGKLYLRYLQSIVCYDIDEKSY
jgi:hypothetical protein